jgi:hypothetical protein
MQPVGQYLRIFKSESLGGLTNYWGATMLPFTDREMSRWPISSKALDPYYEQMAHLVGLAARPDALNETLCGISRPGRNSANHRVGKARSGGKPSQSQWPIQGRLWREPMRHRNTR